MASCFAAYQDKAWPIRYAATIHVSHLAGGTPADDKVAEKWLNTKIKGDRDELIREQIAKIMAERQVTLDEATREASNVRHLNVFKRDPEHGLFIEGRQMKAGLKEAVSVAVASGKLTLRQWGETKKYITNYFPEHVFIPEDRLYLGLHEPTGITQRFIHTFRGTGIQYEEYAEDVKLSFTVVTDHEFTGEQWAMIWLTAEQQGIGASRSQGFGRYEVTSWERLTGKPRSKPPAAGTP